MQQQQPGRVSPFERAVRRSVPQRGHAAAGWHKLQDSGGAHGTGEQPNPTQPVPIFLVLACLPLTVCDEDCVLRFLIAATFSGFVGASEQVMLLTTVLLLPSACRKCVPHCVHVLSLQQSLTPFADRRPLRLVRLCCNALAAHVVHQRR